MILEILLSGVMNYPSLYGHTYTENANENSLDKQFITNDLLLCLMIFARLIYFIRSLLSVSFYTDPRS